MYTTTFYSFKGGVGRTLALVNTGLELAKRGHRVLLVDFDLEAPGIDTIKEVGPTVPSNGLVDYVSDYLRTEQVPKAIEYIYKAELPSGIPGEIWVMPAGLRNRQYAAKLASIDWKKLYEERDGFLLLDDMKRQWDEQLKLDYVLIDSRTGHTEVGGICTRQLPDAVVLLYLPNAQNLLGLAQVVQAIRAEGKRSDGRIIELLFAISNVPDLDDEEEILRRLLADFSRQLEYDRPDVIIHRYDSLSLLNQAVFVLDRPKSRLAREYRALASAIAERNLEDRTGVLRSLRRRNERVLRSTNPEIEDAQLDKIQNAHSADPEVLYELARLIRRRGQMEKEWLLIEQAEKVSNSSNGPIHAKILVRLAELSAIRGEIEQIPQRILLALNNQAVQLPTVLQAINLLNRYDPAAVIKVGGMQGIIHLEAEEQLQVTSELMGSRDGQSAAVEILNRILATPDQVHELKDSARNSLRLCLIGLALFDEALASFSEISGTVAELDVADAFNYAMAELGSTGNPRVELLNRVLQCDENSISRPSGANYQQCLSLVLMLLNRNDEAKKRLAMAADRIHRHPTADFSCWSYLRVTPPQFLKELAEMETSTSEMNVVPRFLQNKQGRLFQRD